MGGASEVDGLGGSTRGSQPVSRNPPPLTTPPRIATGAPWMPYSLPGITGLGIVVRSPGGAGSACDTHADVIPWSSETRAMEALEHAATPSR
jgi:hypothetical protein